MMRPERKAESMINRNFEHEVPPPLRGQEEWCRWHTYIHDAASVVRKKRTRQGWKCTPCWPRRMAPDVMGLTDRNPPCILHASRTGYHLGTGPEILADIFFLSPLILIWSFLAAFWANVVA